MSLNTMKKLFLLLALLAPFAFMSCSEDVTAPSKGTFLPTNTGTWWEMEIYPTDSLGNKDGISSSSTITVGTSYPLNGRTATQYIDRYDDSSDTTLYSSEGQIVYIDGTQFNQIGTYFSAILGGGTAPDINLNLTWVKIADPNTPSWEVAKVPIPETDVSDVIGGGGIKAYLNGEIRVNGSQAGTEQITIKGKTHTASVFNMNIEFAGKVNTTVFFAKVDLASISVLIGQKFYFVDGIGLVKSVNSGQTFELKPISSTLPIPGQKSKTGGSVSTVIDYNIK